MQIPFKQHAGYNPSGDCGKGRCPICARNTALFSFKDLLNGKEFTGDAISPFVGRFGYPNVNVGILAPPEQKEDSHLYDAPRIWSKNNYEIASIVGFRSSLLNSRSQINIKQKAKLLEIAQDVAMASKPFDIDILLHEKPKFRLNLDSYMAPTGPNASLKSARIAQNPRIEAKVYRVFGDIDLKASDAINYLYENDFDENFLSRMLSIGTVGVKKDRKLVPTRWAITATHDILGKRLIAKVKDFGNAIDYLIFFGGYLGNYYMVLCFPQIWNYELFEMYVKNEKKHSTDYEGYDGRKDYASNTAGGYYTARLAILEKLNLLKRHGAVLALRFITDEYTMPLGVWVTLEASRKAIGSGAINFSSKELMIDYAKNLALKKFNFNIEKILQRSILLKSANEQSKLSRFF